MITRQRHGRPGLASKSRHYGLPRYCSSGQALSRPSAPQALCSAHLCVCARALWCRALSLGASERWYKQINRSAESECVHSTRRIHCGKRCMLGMSAIGWGESSALLRQCLTATGCGGAQLLCAWQLEYQYVPVDTSRYAAVQVSLAPVSTRRSTRRGVQTHSLCLSTFKVHFVPLRPPKPASSIPIFARSLALPSNHLSLLFNSRSSAISTGT